MNLCEEEKRVEKEYFVLKYFHRICYSKTFDLDVENNRITLNLYPMELQIG